MKLLQSEKFGRCYYFQIIRFALSLHGKSPAAYRELRDSGALILPSERVLRDFKNYLKSKAGINIENIDNLKEKASPLSGIQRYVVLVMDEMKIQSNLVFFYSDQEFALHTLPKLSLDHIVLTSYSKMKVRLATQVLSKSVAFALEESGKDDVTGTAQFCRMMNDFFDCANVRSLTEHVRKRNHLIKPYEMQDDERLTWLKDVFLKYLDDWRASTMQREGNYSADDRGKMFLSLQTYKGLKICVHSHIEAIQFLLAEGFQYVLSERFMQDVLEDYFGHHRAKSGHSDNPTAQQFGYNDLTIAAQRDIAPVIRGNVGGKYEEKKWFQVGDEPVKKRRKPKK
ncbi:uncharacterized protein LOC114526750 [Dendronephthya gigantea]|uniref:uncharacterized protein LOC114526750 n=1 Tax=Dendronephthya gigantea TaxID=151771 RepID=UPI00106D3C88|nr:uncharacterized protein LOC114526750 [Dendronephthya gigantea]